MATIACSCIHPHTVSGAPVPDAGCFLCGGSGKVGQSKEAQAWYQARKACLAEAQGNAAHAQALLESLERQYDRAFRGDVRSRMGDHLDRVRNQRV